MGKNSALARQIAELSEFVPKDPDPEEDVRLESSEDGNGSEDSQEDVVGTEHYVEVGTSKLRKRDEVALGPQYSGSRVSRIALQDDYETENSDYENAEKSHELGEYADPDVSDMDVDIDVEEDEDIDSDEAFDKSDEEKFRRFSFCGSRVHEHDSDKRKKGIKPGRMAAADFMSGSADDGSTPELENGRVTNDDIEDSDEASESLDDDEGSVEGISSDEEIQGNGRMNDEADSESESESDAVEEESDASDRNGHDQDEDFKARRAELRKIMNEEQKSVVATISQAAKADAEKGNAVKQQRKTFDSLLNVRIRLQKALVATNSMHTAEEKSENAPLPYQAAEEAAIKLLNTLDAMRQELNTVHSSINGNEKRKRTVDVDTPSSAIWQDMQNLETGAIGVRRTTLEKWSTRVRDTTAMPVTRKLNITVAQPTIIDLLQEQLSNSERLVKRTKMPRSCAPIQTKMKITDDPNIFDDADFYQLLLKELVDQRMMDSSSTSAALGEGGRPIAQWTAAKEAKTKKNVDTRASKGRKLRYTVHEKLQNFMAPEDRSTWEPDAIDRFFGTLLGQKMTLGEDDGNDNDDGEEAVPLAEEGLMLFRS